MNDLDPAGAILRSLRSPIVRRTYSVVGPNSLWHFDGNHRLIRWNIVIHCCIDGFSRVNIYLAATDNNRAATVLELFKAGVDEDGLPSRVRCDMGGENADVCSFMEERRGLDRGSAIRGKSVHDQRVERLWVDVWKGVTNIYHDVFSYLEQTNLLEAGNAMHLWALHFVYLPRINADLNLFKAQWNHHGLISEGHMSPHQLFVSRALELFGSERTGIKDLFDPSVEPEVTDLYGVENENMDLEGPEEPEEQAGEAQLVQCPLSDEALEELRRHVNPENDQDELGIQSYQQVLEFIQTHLHV